MDELQSVALGCVLGLVVLAVLTKFPGEPFDYDPHAERNPDNISNNSQTPPEQHEAALERKKQEIEQAASRLRVDKLQRLLGLEKDKVQELVEQAKRDALLGRQPSGASDYSRWMDWAFYAVILGLMAVVLRAEYSVDIVELGRHVFPREAEAARKILALPRQWLPGW